MVLDLREQNARINNLEADTEMKLQAIRNAKIQLFLAIAAVVVAVGGAVTGGLTLYFGAHAHHDTYIFLTPG